MKIMVLGFLLLSGCAGFPPFQNLNNGVGYQVRDIQGPSAFVVIATLPDSAGENYTKDYALRAGVETCIARGYGFVNTADERVTSPSPKSIQVEKDFYCYKENQRRALGVTFKIAPKNASDAKIAVEHMNTKQNPKVQKDDLVLAVNGTPVSTIDEIKKIVFFNEGKSAIPITVVRNGKTQTVEEPIVLFTGSLFSQDDLNLIREKVK